MIYAIGVESKRHAIYTKGAPLGAEDFRLVEADDNGWIEWNGGECPLPDGSECGVKHRDGEVFNNTFAGSNLASDWSHTCGVGDIIAYRPILDQQPEGSKAVGLTPCPQCNGDGIDPSDPDAVTSCPGCDGEGEVCSSPHKAPEWDGEGDYPPVGNVCLKGCKKVRILAHTNVGSPYDPAVVWQGVDEPSDIDWAVCNVFAPLRIPAQRAEDEAVHAMRAQDCNPFEGMLSRHDFCRAIYAAIRDGKIPGVKLED